MSPAMKKRKTKIQLVLQHFIHTWLCFDTRDWNKDFRTANNFTEKWQIIAPGLFLSAQIYLRTRGILPSSRHKFALCSCYFKAVGLVWHYYSNSYSLDKVAIALQYTIFSTHSSARFMMNFCFQNSKSIFHYSF